MNSSLQTSTDDTAQDSELLEELYLKYYKIRKKLLMLIQIDTANYQILAREKSISLISLDIARTFPEMELFQEG
jgi:predicted TIM-barrel fold metal-dependent hydrolase